MQQQIPTPEEKGLVRDTLELGSRRKALRQRHGDFASTQKKQARKAFQQAQTEERQQQLLLTWARVYLEGAGNKHVRRNVTKAIHKQAEEYSKQTGEPFTTSLKRVEEAMLGALVRSLA